MGLSSRTVERWQKSDGFFDQRNGATKKVHNKLTARERQKLIETANGHKYRDLPPSKIVPLLADEGRYVASESTFYRVLKEENQLTHRHKSRPSTHQRPEPYVARAPNQVWSWDITYLPTLVCGLYFYLYVIMDIFSRKIVGWSIHERESSECSAKLIQQAYQDEKVQPHQLVLHSDNGAPMKGLTMLSMLQNLGVVPSFSRPSVSDDNPYSESLFKTLKYHPRFPLTEKFKTLEDARLWSEKFTLWYNNEHLHSALNFVTPMQRHRGEDKKIHNNRLAVYEQAKQTMPHRWSGEIRTWRLEDEVYLNSNRKISKNKDISTYKLEKIA